MLPFLALFLIVQPITCDQYLGPTDTVYKADCRSNNALECSQKGCVWQVSENDPWCFYESSRFECLPSRADANEDACSARNCHWNALPSVESVPKCYHRLPKALIDCHPDKDANQERCERRGCLWLPKAAKTKFMPWCFFRGDSSHFSGYDLDDSDPGDQNDTNGEFQGTLHRRDSPTVFGGDFNKLKVHVVPVANNHARIMIAPADYVFRSHSNEIRNYLSTKHDTSNLRYRVITSAKPFGFAIERTDTNKTIFDTRKLPGLTVAKQYLQLSAYLGSRYIYGLGETANPHLRRNLKWGDNIGLFSRDIGPMAKENVRQQQNLYGVHPIYLGMEDGGTAHAVYWNNLHALNIVLQPNPDVITYRAIGGFIDLHVFIGDSPAEATAAYVSMIGKPYLPPYWGLGFQLSRYGYEDTADLRKTFQRNHDIGIPQDVQYIDIDYMREKLDFTYDEKQFAGLPEFVSYLHSKGVKLVPITDPGIASRRNDYEVYERGLLLDVFIKNATGMDLEGKVWPGITVYPDFTHSNATSYWLTELKEFHQRISFDGMWYDMNEVSNFVPGSLQGCEDNPVNHPPYNPIMDNPIYTKTLCLDALSYEGRRQYEIHSLYGYDQTRVSHEAHLKLFPGKRPFILSRSTAPGSGVHTAHWSGDVFSLWETLTYAIVNMLEFSIYGMPWTGSDICGFNGETNEQLCIRWSQQGAFYPFSRNHNSIGVRDQDPAVWSSSSQKIIRDVLRIRYKYLPYMYTLMVKSSMDASHTVARPLFINFPVDIKTYDIDTQFMLGTGIMVAPVTRQDNKAHVYFPPGKWHGLELSNETILSPPKSGIHKTYQYEMDRFGLFAFGGVIIPWQLPSQTTSESRKNPFGLLVTFDTYNHAEGELYFDDGESVDSYTGEGRHKYFKFEAGFTCDGEGGFLTVTKIQDTYPNVNMPNLNVVQFKGLRKVPKNFTLDGMISIPEENVKELSESWVELIEMDLAWGSKNTIKVSWACD